MPNNVTMFKTIGGEFYIGEMCSPDEYDDYYVLENARVFQIQMTPSGAAIALSPLFPFGKIEDERDRNRLSIKKSNIILIAKNDEIDQEIRNAYISHISGLDLSTGRKPNLIVPKL